MQAIYKDIRALRSDIKNEMGEFRLSFRDGMRKEMAEAGQRITDIEEWDTAAKEALTLALENQEALQVQLTKLEARSRCNNLCIHGIPEESEGSNLSEFLTKLIKSQLGPALADIDLGIQRCHRVTMH